MKSFYLLVICCLAATPLFAQRTDTLHIIPHNKTLMVTDPSRGVNESLKWAVFPSKSTPYRKITAHITLQCPDGMKCGAWDYIDAVILRRTGSVHGEDKKQELVRILTPYGGWFDNKWRFTWRQDVTDWGVALRDSVEIEYQHTGYEANTVGWLATVDFEVITGTPVMEPLDYQPLWSKSFAYGDTARPFPTLLTPQTVTVPGDAKYMNYRINQTGHGMDRPDNCSEFCDKWREVYVDGKMIDHRQMLIVCGNNPVYPQAGTWVYSRANWCPGSLSIPDIYTLPVTKHEHSFDLKMEPYVSKNPQGGWFITANVFFYKSPSAKNDVALERIITPSADDEYGRMNPACANPRILIKNNGGKPLEKLTIEYGFRRSKKQTYTWKGYLSLLQTTEVELPGALAFTKDKETFEVKLLNPNGKKDEFPADNVGWSQAVKPPVYARDMVLTMMTNRDSTQTSWTIYDAAGVKVYQRRSDSLRSSTLYTDTLRLHDGCYMLLIEDTDNDGLNFWANPRGGYGYIRLFDMDKKLVKNFDPNFGTSMIHYFAVSANAPAITPETVFEFFPARTKNRTMADIVVDRPQTIELRFVDEKNVVQWEQKINNFTSRMFPIDMSFLPPSFYWVTLKLEDGREVTRSIRKVEN